MIGTDWDAKPWKTHEADDRILLRFKYDETWMEWEVYLGDRQPDGSWVFVEDGEFFEEPVPDKNRFAHGDLKWDGCVHVWIDEMQRDSKDADTACYLHFCGPEKDPVLGRMMRAVYSLGPHMESWVHGGGRL